MSRWCASRSTRFWGAWRVGGKGKEQNVLMVRQQVHQAWAHGGEGGRQGKEHLNGALAGLPGPGHVQGRGEGREKKVRQRRTWVEGTGGRRARALAARCRSAVQLESRQLGHEVSLQTALPKGMHGALAYTAWAACNDSANACACMSGLLVMAQHKRTCTKGLSL
eukprot:363560-Chlamydomonas_euryale.AAC.4